MTVVLDGLNPVRATSNTAHASENMRKYLAEAVFQVIAGEARAAGDGMKPQQPAIR